MKTATLATLAAFLTAVGCSASAQAATFTVTSLFDSGIGTLRSAVAQAAASPGPDTIAFHPSLGGVIALQSMIFVHEDLQFVVPSSSRITLDLSAAGIGFYVEDVPAENTPTEIGFVNLEVVHGNSFLFSSVDTLRLNVQRCIFREIGSFSTQAGVFNPSFVDRKLTGVVQSSCFINNRGLHAGVFITNPDPAGNWLQFVNCTFVGNSSTYGGGVGWIWNNSLPGQGGAAFTNCTITGNSGGESGLPMGAIYISSNPTASVQPACQIKNCVVAENVAGAAVADANFTGLYAGATSLQGNNIFASPGLAEIRYVGSTYVRMPLPGSPCIDSAAADPSVRFDQAGTQRPQVAAGATLPAGSDGGDIGAVEVVPVSCAADFNRSGSVTVQDIFDFLAAFFAGCP